MLALFKKKYLDKKLLTAEDHYQRSNSQIRWIFEIKLSSSQKDFEEFAQKKILSLPKFISQLQIQNAIVDISDDLDNHILKQCPTLHIRISIKNRTYKIAVNHLYVGATKFLKICEFILEKSAYNLSNPNLIWWKKMACLAKTTWTYAKTNAKIKTPKIVQSAPCAR